MKGGDDEQEIEFNVYPYGTEFQIGKSVGGDFVILFKVNEKMYKYNKNLSKDKER